MLIELADDVECSVIETLKAHDGCELFVPNNGQIPCEKERRKVQRE